MSKRVPTSSPLWLEFFFFFFKLCEWTVPVLWHESVCVSSCVCVHIITWSFAILWIWVHGLGWHCLPICLSDLRPETNASTHRHTYTHTRTHPYPTSAWQPFAQKQSSSSLGRPPSVRIPGAVWPQPVPASPSPHSSSLLQQHHPMAIVLLSAIVCLSVPSKHFSRSDLQELAKFNSNLNEDKFQKYIMARQKLGDWANVRHCLEMMLVTLMQTFHWFLPFATLQNIQHDVLSPYNGSFLTALFAFFPVHSSFFTKQSVLLTFFMNDKCYAYHHLVCSCSPLCWLSINPTQQLVLTGNLRWAQWVWGDLLYFDSHFRCRLLLY